MVGHWYESEETPALQMGSALSVIPNQLTYVYVHYMRAYTRAHGDTGSRSGVVASVLHSGK